MDRTTPDCLATRQHLHLHVGGDLDGTQADLVRDHLEGCADCSAALAAARRSRELYLSTAIDADREPLDLWPLVRARLADEGRLAGERRPAGRLLTFRPSGRAAGLAAAAAAVLAAVPLLTGVLGQGGTEGSAETADRGRVESAPALAVPVTPVSAEPAGRGGSGLRVVPAVEGPTAGPGGLRPVPLGTESLAERAWRERFESGDAGTPHPLAPDLHQVVRDRGLR